MKWTRQRCQVAPMTRVIAALRALVGIGDDQLDPGQPRRTRSFRKVAQKVSASLGPMCRPTISRRLRC